MENIIIGDYEKQTKHMSFELPIIGEAWVQGELYFNEKESRYEHTATDADGKEYLIVSTKQD